MNVDDEISVDDKSRPTIAESLPTQSGVSAWPSSSSLTARLRRLITAYQRSYRQEQLKIEAEAKGDRRRRRCEQASKLKEIARQERQQRYGAIGRHWSTPPMYQALFHNSTAVFPQGGPAERSAISTASYPHSVWRRSKESRAFWRESSPSSTGTASAPSLVWIKRRMKASAATSAPLWPCAVEFATCAPAGVKVISRTPAVERGGGNQLGAVSKNCNSSKFLTAV